MGGNLRMCMNLHAQTHYGLCVFNGTGRWTSAASPVFAPATENKRLFEVQIRTLLYHSVNSRRQEKPITANTASAPTIVMRHVCLLHVCVRVRQSKLCTPVIIFRNMHGYVFYCFPQQNELLLIYPFVCLCACRHTHTGKIRCEDFNGGFPPGKPPQGLIAIACYSLQLQIISSILSEPSFTLASNHMRSVPSWSAPYPIRQQFTTT